MLPLHPRQTDILDIARIWGRVDVESLAEKFNVTPQTIRKDLNELCERDILHRVHGGAVYPSSTSNFAYLSRRSIASDAKSSIANKAASLIPNDSSLIMNIGTTVELAAEALKGHEGLMVVTNNLNVAHILSGAPDIELVITGGVVRKNDLGIVGAAAIDLINQFKVDIAIIGVSAIDSDGCLLDFDYREVRVAKAILKQSRKTILVADNMKFERRAPVQIGHLSDIDIFITDLMPSPEIVEICERSGVELEITGPMKNSSPSEENDNITHLPISDIKQEGAISQMVEDNYDILIIGGGINGCGIARDAVGRGYSVCLCEAGDLGGGTSSASTKLIHGGLRYLEYYEFRLVREALMEREVIWKMAPHIVKPLRFILPHHKGLRPKWLLRLGLFFYDHMGGRKLLPASTTIDLTKDEAGKPLKPEFRTAFEYSDCWVNDSRLVLLNAMDARNRGAQILPRTRVRSARKINDRWEVDCEELSTGKQRQISAKLIVNAAGPWVDEVLRGVFGLNGASNVRLVRGSHIVIEKKFQHDKCYIFQYSDGRIVFAIPYEGEYTLIGTTDAEHGKIEGPTKITDEESEYLCRVASDYFAQPVTQKDIVWTYSGVRPLYDDGASEAKEATRDYVLVREKSDSVAPLINIFGGKITTYRKLAEAMLVEIGSIIGKKGTAWTKNTHLPGGEFATDDLDAQIGKMAQKYPFLSGKYLTRLVGTYGTCVDKMLDGVSNIQDLGEDFGNELFEREVEYLVENEWALEMEDIAFRRTKLGIKFTQMQQDKLTDFLQKYQELKRVKPM